MIILYLLISVILIILLTARYKLHPFLALFIVAIMYGLLAGMSLELIVESINQGFGNTLGSIGLIILFGVIIGAFLENTGAAYVIADKILKVIGRKRVAPGMGIIGYFISIPVFADSGFILLSPLNKSLTKKAGLSLAGTAVALGLGLTASHTMLPPTPGPIAAAGILNADLGLVMLIGLPVSLLALTVGIFFAVKIAARTKIEPNPDTSDAEIQERVKNAPGAIHASFPVLVPILLIILKSLTVGLEFLPEGNLYQFILFIGDPVIALMIGVILAFTLPKNLTPIMLSSSGWMGKAIETSASVIMITGAGGIFGMILQNSGIADVLGEQLADVHLGIFLPFLLTAAIKTAQGSSTVALITAASIMMPMMESLGFETEIQKALVVLAIGAGSSVVAHANDSFFWVVTQLSGMTTKTGYKLYTTGTLILGSTAGIIVFIIYQLIA
jgi:GntP family gluconate:H+ symporter